MHGPRAGDGARNLQDLPASGAAETMRVARPQVSIVIPTMNRSEFLARLCRYYAHTGFQGVLCIGDSSQEVHLERTQRVIEECGRQLAIRYCTFPGLSEPEVSERLLHTVSTPYVTWLGDDDLLIPSAIDRCISFLDSRPDYSVAQGVAVVAMLASDGRAGRIERILRYAPNARPITFDDPRERLLAYLANYFVADFAVHRTTQLQEAFTGVSALRNRVFRELLVCCYALIQGKVGLLNCLYLVRQHHAGRADGKLDAFDRIMHSSWPPAYEMFRERLAGALTHRCQVSMDEAREVVKRAFWSYLGKSFVKKGDERYGQRRADPLNRVRQALWAIPGLQKTWHQVRWWNAPTRNESTFSAPALLQSSSPYYRDFMPVYRALTSPN